MDRVQITKEQWRLARKVWERDPLATYADISASLGVSRQAVKQRAGREGWQKEATPESVAAKAHAQVDAAKVSYLPAHSSEQAPAVYSTSEVIADPKRPPMLRSVPTIPEGTTPEQAAEVIDKAVVDERARVIAQHRGEWKSVRSKIYDVIKVKGTPSGEDTRALKALAESMRILQDGERRSYGLEAGGEGGQKPAAPPVQFVVRRGGKANAG
jgi:hypothetical protein